MKEAYTKENDRMGEKEKINNWISLVQNKFVSFSTIYPRPSKGKYFLQLLSATKAKGVNW